MPSVNLIAQGTGVNQMLGSKVYIKRISVRFEIYMTSGGDAAIQNVFNDRNARVMLVLDKQCNGAAAVISQILSSNNFNSFMNIENSKRFIILKEWMINPPAQDIGFNGTAYYHGISSACKKWSKSCNYLVDFAAQAGGSRTISEVRSNNILLLGISDTAPFSFRGRIRIRYADN